jgi:hypothetical protein
VIEPGDFRDESPETQAMLEVAHGADLVTCFTVTDLGNNMGAVESWTYSHPQSRLSVPHLADALRDLASQIEEAGDRIQQRPEDDR